VSDHPRIVIRAVTWNLFHGRDFPPDPALFTARSKFLRVTERNATHEQVNRPLRREFTDLLGRIEWDIALLQEAPPRWHDALVRDLRATGALVLTSRNSLGRLRGRLADLNPDLVASNEGGSNQLLVREPWRIEETRAHTLTDEPERRQMLWARLRDPGGASLAIANLHGSVPGVPGHAEQVIAAAERAVEWAGDLPLVFGGDLNLRSQRHAAAFDELDRRFGLAPRTPGNELDHLLVRGLDLVEPPHAAPAEARELPVADKRAIRLSDHAYVTSTLGMK
jgi:endonuclease/exonuclease/phosphatase family metal-dependent hydrolase